MLTICYPGCPALVTSTSPNSSLLHQSSNTTIGPPAWLDEPTLITGGGCDLHPHHSLPLPSVIPPAKPQTKVASHEARRQFLSTLAPLAACVVPQTVEDQVNVEIKNIAIIVKLRTDLNIVQTTNRTSFIMANGTPV